MSRRRSNDLRYLCDEHHPDCALYNGPFIVVDANTGRRLRSHAFHTLKSAFVWGDRVCRYSDKDYRVLDRSMDVVKKSVIGDSWLYRSTVQA